MISKFNILSGSTLPNTFKWNGVYPALSSNVSPVYQGYNISGNAPNLTIGLSNLSIPDTLTSNDQIFYIWDFGDYYNLSTNTYRTSSISEIVSHTYIMPGKYTVSLTIQENILSTLSNVINISPDACFGKYCIIWNWGNLQSNTPNFLTWKDASSIGNYTATYGDSKFVNNNCNTRTSSYYKTLYTQSSIVNSIIVNEILPIAKLNTVINPAIGTSPLTLQICPSASLCGSFPYDRIVWDYGDGSPIDIVTRFITPNSNFVYTNAYPDDINDPRNYNAVHTYTKTVSSTFYPSITAYTMNTNQLSIANTVVGPISYGSINTSPLHIMKVRNSINGNMYGIQSGNNFSVINTLPRTKLSTFPTVNTIVPYIPPILGGNACYIGFGASTGALTDNHWLYDMTWNSNLQTIVFPEFLHNSTLLNAASSVDGVISLCFDANNIGGNAFYDIPMIITDANGNLIDWHVTYVIAIGGGSGADGLSFILQSNESTPGSIGGGMGYAGIPNSVGISLDTFYNSDSDIYTDNHIEINVDGNISESYSNVAEIPFMVRTAISPIYGVQGSPAYIWVDYVSGIMQIFIAQTNIKPNTALISYPIDLRTYLITTPI